MILMHDAKFAESPQSPRRMNYSTGSLSQVLIKYARFCPEGCDPGSHISLVNPGLVEILPAFSAVD